MPNLLHVTAMAQRALAADPAPEPMQVVCAWCLREQGLPHPERATDVTCERHVPDMREAWGVPRERRRVA